ncbi:PREDICTED: interferon beta [Propithecus coquereli]|uniref:interferon beta n=1 Tax=Propithecus coquereli TaxID=379532 RepID=UPI00063F1DB1|nr:PREDICTED: interferon beta [Propithecus coquereli]
MTNMYILQVTLLLCFSTTALSVSYDLLRFRQRSSSFECQKLLQQLNGRPENCLQDRIDFEVPEEITQPQHLQKEYAALFIYEMLQNIFGIFRRDVSSTGWNETIVEDLLAKFYQQMDRLETILAEKLEEENFTRGKIKNILHLKGYYFRIMQYLKAKEYSSCAWTIVRVEILRNFFFINRLTAYLQN